MKSLAFILMLLSAASIALAAETIPARPARYFNDYAHVVSAGTAEQLNRTLEDFERQTSNQVLVVVYPKMQSDSSIEDYTVRVAQAWGVGQKGRSNGAVLFVFIQDRSMFLQVGYGLEGALPDALAQQIIENELKPRFRSGDYDGGLRAGVTAILAATRGEYKGTGRTVGEQSNKGAGWVAILFLIFVFAIAVLRARRGRMYGGGGMYPVLGAWVLGRGWGGRSSGGWGGGGGFGGGGFSGGGGSFGGGGAGGRW